MALTNIIKTADSINALTGFVIRPKFIYKDADEVYIDPGVYHHHGTINQSVYWDDQLTKQLAGAGANTWYYLYIDDSAIVTAESSILTADELIFSTTAPTWSNSKHGRYNGNDRCITAVRTDGSNNIREFFHNGNFILYADNIVDLASTDIDTAWTNVTLTIPAFAVQAEILNSLFSNGDTNTCSSYWRTDGQSGTTGHWANWVDQDFDKRSLNTFKVITSTSQIIEIKHSISGLQQTEIDTLGWYFPEGM